MEKHKFITEIGFSLTGTANIKTETKKLKIKERINKMFDLRKFMVASTLGLVVTASSLATPMISNAEFIKNNITAKKMVKPPSKVSKLSAMMSKDNLKNIAPQTLNSVNNFYSSKSNLNLKSRPVPCFPVIRHAVTCFPVNRRPEISLPDNVNWVNFVDDEVSENIIASDPDGDILIYSASNLPPGLSIDSVTGLISGTIDPYITNENPYSVSVSVSDGQFVSQFFKNWTVLEGEPLEIEVVNIDGQQDVDPLPMTIRGPDGQLQSFTLPSIEHDDSPIPLRPLVSPGDVTLSQGGSVHKPSEISSTTRALMSNYDDSMSAPVIENIKLADNMAIITLRDDNTGYLVFIKEKGINTEKVIGLSRNERVAAFDQLYGETLKPGCTYQLRICKIGDSGVSDDKYCDIILTKPEAIVITDIVEEKTFKGKIVGSFGYWDGDYNNIVPGVQEGNGSFPRFPGHITVDWTPQDVALIGNRYAYESYREEGMQHEEMVQADVILGYYLDMDGEADPGTDERDLFKGCSDFDSGEYDADGPYAFVALHLKIEIDPITGEDKSKYLVMLHGDHLATEDPGSKVWKSASIYDAGITYVIPGDWEQGIPNIIQGFVVVRTDMLGSTRNVTFNYRLGLNWFR